MRYSQADITYIEDAARASSSTHVTHLRDMLLRDEPYADIFAYGVRHLPTLKNEHTGQHDVEVLNNYRPEIVEYFDVIADIPSLPNALKDVALDCAIYADGEAAQTDEYYLMLEPKVMIENALKKT